MLTEFFFVWHSSDKPGLVWVLKRAVIMGVDNNPESCFFRVVWKRNRCGWVSVGCDAR